MLSFPRAFFLVCGVPSAVLVCLFRVVPPASAGLRAPCRRLYLLCVLFSYSFSVCDPFLVAVYGVDSPSLLVWRVLVGLFSIGFWCRVDTVLILF